MNLTQWRSDPNLIDSADKHLKTKTGKAMMDVLTEERPSNKPLPTMGATGFDHAYANGIEVGYRACVTTIKAMAVALPSQEEIMATFEEESDDNG
jgi:hypothetical protein